MQSDLEIAHSYNMKPITEIAERLEISADDIECYGKYKAKVISPTAGKKRGKLILVTAITPTAAGEGKTTISIGLADALRLKGKDVALALREPSLGPVFGLKGGATGGGRAQVVPMEDINLHFTGDFHAIESANNLIAALLDNSIMQGNRLGIDPRTVTWKRCMDMNDRQLRSIVSGLGGKSNGMPREDGFEITTASEIMALLCLSTDLEDLKRRLSGLLLARTYEGKAVTLKDINGTGAAAALLKDAIKPNLVQTLFGTPALIHGGPFANIAHGCNSIIATHMALTHSDITVTEAGFGADLGAEKFIDIKCRQLGKLPDCVVLVASIRALKSHGGVKKDELAGENVEAVRLGLSNLDRHLDNITKVWKLPAVIAINHFPGDSEAESNVVKEYAKVKGAPCAFTEVWGKGAEGGFELAEEVLKQLEEEREEGAFTYEADIPLSDKIRTVARRIYRADGVTFAPGVISKLKKAEAEGYASFPICIAKTQYSFSDDPKKQGAPSSFNITIRDVKVAAGAGFIIAYAGDIITMPGLPKVPAAEGIDIDSSGEITGLF